MPSGRRPGYKHSEETREKIRKSRLGQIQEKQTREKISESLIGRPKSTAHRDAISDSLSDLDRKCMRRYLELRAEYPDHQDFFDERRSELLLAMRSIKSEKELRDIRKYIETTPLEDAPQVSTCYQYASNSCYAQEDAVIALLDAASFLRKILSTNSGDLVIN